MKTALRPKSKAQGPKSPASPDSSLVAPSTALVQPVQPDVMLMGASSSGNRARQWNRWRERYNPLRGLNIARAVTLLEQYQRGEMADPCWVYFFIEQTDADLFALLERREAALVELDWNVKLMSGRWAKDDPRQKDFDKNLASEQSVALREAYEGIDNLYESIAHLQLATFRGFAHCEKWRNSDGDVYHLELVDQWNMVRDLLRGRWKYNPEANSTTFYGISDDNLVDPANFLIRERDRHVNRIALIKFIRANLSEKDWDAFIEIYGIPSGVVIGPQGVAPEKESEYKSAAQNIAEGGSGYLPNGSEYVPNVAARGDSPFKPRLEYLTEKLILAGTGGMLTMLAESGSGTLAGGAHQDTFEQIARAEARKISEIFQRQLDREVLEKAFPGQPALVYFEIAANDELDPNEICEQVAKLAVAGYKVDVAQLSEKLGYNLTLAPIEKIDVRETEELNPDGTIKKVPAPKPALASDPAQLLNRATRAAHAFMQRASEDALVKEALQAVGKGVAEDLQPILNRLTDVLALPDANFTAGLLQFHSELPELCTQCLAVPATAKAYADALGAALASGLTERTPTK